MESTDFYSLSLILMIGCVASLSSDKHQIYEDFPLGFDTKLSRNHEGDEE